jgi:peroxiredoxin
VRCQQEAPVIEKEIWQRFKDKGLRVFAIGVNENNEQASSWSSRHQLTYPVIIDAEGEVYKKFGTGSVPYHVLIDKNFIIRHSEEKFDKGSLIRLLDDCIQEKI